MGSLINTKSGENEFRKCFKENLDRVKPSIFHVIHTKASNFKFELSETSSLKHVIKDHVLNLEHLQIQSHCQFG